MTARSAEDRTINLFDHRSRSSHRGGRAAKEGVHRAGGQINQFWVDMAVQVGKEIAQSAGGHNDGRRYLP